MPPEVGVLGDAHPGVAELAGDLPHREAALVKAARCAGRSRRRAALTRRSGAHPMDDPEDQAVTEGQEIEGEGSGLPRVVGWQIGADGRNR